MMLLLLASRPPTPERDKTLLLFYIFRVLFVKKNICQQTT